MQVIRSHPFITKFIFCVAALATVVSCKTYSNEELDRFDKDIQVLLEKNGWKMQRSESGLYTEILDKGDTTSRAVSFSSELKLDYKGKLLGGKTVDQSEPGKPLETKLGGLIGGFQEGLFDQHQGARIRMVIPPQLGYGDEAKGKIPASSVLVFEVEIVEVY